MTTKHDLHDLVDELPEVDGLRERWGHQVLHCPYCHGWEVRDQRIGVLATGPAAVHQALLFSQLSDGVAVLAHTAPPAPADRARLAAAGVRVQEGEVVAAGTGARNEAGEVHPLEVKAGDKVLFGKWSGTEVKVDGEDLIIMKESDILGIVS